MADSDRCDALLWDVDGALLDRVRSELAGRVRREGPKFESEAGHWRGHRVVAARPQRAIAKRLAHLADVVGSLVAAHKPEVVVVVGPAAAVDRSMRPGEVVVRSSGALDAANGVRDGAVSQGVVARDSNEQGVLATTDWSDREADALESHGLEFALLAVVTTAPTNPVVQPPRSARRTLAREAGNFFGALARGSIGAPGAPAAITRSAADAVASVLDSFGRSGDPVD